MRRFFVYALLILIFFLVGLLLANFIIMPSIVRRGKEVTVPNVCGVPLDTATAILKKNQLQGVVVERRFDKIIDEGMVIIQEPLPGTKVKRGRIINLSVSLGPETIQIPDLTGLEFTKAKLIIEKLAIALDAVDSAYSDSIPPGRIIQTSPPADSEIVKGSSIRVVISRGPLLKMPNLVGQPLAAARDTLKKLSLVVREIKEIEGSGEKNTVMVQSPEPDRIVNPGDSVNLMVVK